MSENAERETCPTCVEKSSEPSYNGWLISPCLWKRALAVYGHTLLVQLAIGLAGGFIVFCIMIFALLMGLGR